MRGESVVDAHYVNVWRREVEVELHGQSYGFPDYQWLGYSSGTHGNKLI